MKYFPRIRYVSPPQNTVSKCKDVWKVPHGKDGTLKQYTDERERVEAEFNSFMYKAIRNCALNVTRMITLAEDSNSGLSLETLDEGCFGEYLAVEDEQSIESGIELELTSLKIRVNDDLLKKLLNGLTERERQALILHEAFDFDYAQIGKLLGNIPGQSKSIQVSGTEKGESRCKKTWQEKTGLAMT